MKKKFIGSSNGEKRECLTKNQILGIVEEMEKEWVSIPEWGHDKGIYIRVMTAMEKDAYQRSLLQRNPDGTMFADSTNVTAKLVAACAVNEDGKLLFDFSDIIPLGKKSSVVMERLAEVARRLNGIGQKEMEKLLKNLLKTQGEDSSLD